MEHMRGRSHHGSFGSPPPPDRKSTRRSAPPDVRSINFVSARGAQPAQQLSRYFPEKKGVNFRSWTTPRNLLWPMPSIHKGSRSRTREICMCICV
ncbi:unnamed protein product [Cylicocyclus nassatus]|uniref:Uncharacterized protein n=1 Tax=Cylicocyclus nassatus TaxID=53992 RepID=A0AA36MH78_CYLNA|nr:unnamed protein product [Cylicocyclus nassatus]